MTDTPEWKNMADWSDLPDVYVTKAECQQGMFWRVEACSVPMALGPEVRLIRADRVAAALAPDAGIKTLAELRKGRDEAQGLIYAARLERNLAEDQEKELASELRTLRAERDALRARLAEMEGKVGALRDFVEDFAKAKIDALRYSPPHGSSPEDEPDPVVDAETVWAWQSDAKDALAAAGGDA